MIALIGWFAARTGLGSLASTVIAYLVIALLAGSGLWAYSAYRYHQGYNAGVTVERAAWVAKQEEERARQLAKAAADQRKIDQIERDYLALQGQLAETQTALEEAIHADGNDPKPAMPKSIAKALNGVGR